MERPPSRRFHIVIDAFGCNKEKLQEIPFIEETVKDIARILKMNILKGPVTVVGVPQNPGITSFAIIDFSHISIHTFTNSDEFYLDIFSCKRFDPSELVGYIKDRWEITDEQILLRTVTTGPEISR